MRTHPQSRLSYITLKEILFAANHSIILQTINKYTNYNKQIIWMILDRVTINKYPLCDIRSNVQL